MNGLTTPTLCFEDNERIWDLCADTENKQRDGKTLCTLTVFLHSFLEGIFEE